MKIGHIDGLEVGDVFSGQAELFRLGLHGDHQQGISGKASTGSDSIILAGGYADDEDFGDEIIYTGMTPGSWDKEKKTTKANQKMTGKNLALVKNELDQIPIRVWRSSKHASPWSPENGISYAGLYYVISHWSKINDAGHIVFMFKLSKNTAALRRKQVVREELTRYADNVSRIKSMYKSTCQVCRISLELPSGPYAEACHIQPLGRPHNGPDIVSNMICLCPNHHVLFDNGGFGIENDFRLIGVPGTLWVAPNHAIDSTHLKYHRQIILAPELRTILDSDQ